MSEYERLSDEELTDAISRIVVQLNQRLTMQFLSIAEELIQYRAKLESGRLVELPCKVGDTIYYVEYFCNYKSCSADTQRYCCGCKEMIERERRHEKYVIAEKKFSLTDLSQIGKKYLLTKEAAEARLKELQEGKK